jgi:hypothetical protein
MTDQPLSPAAEAVFTAILNLKDNINPRHRIAAAALRAAANDWRVDTEFMGGVEYIRTSTLERIAASLEGSNG